MEKKLELTDEFLSEMLERNIMNSGVWKQTNGLLAQLIMEVRETNRLLEMLIKDKD